MCICYSEQGQQSEQGKQREYELTVMQWRSTFTLHQKVGGESMARIFLIAVACVTLVAFVGACGPDAKRENPVRQDMPEKYKRTQPEKPAQKKATQHNQIKGRKRYEAFAGARIRDAENRLEEMKSRAMHSSGSSRRRSERGVHDLQSCIHEANVNLNKLESANANTWEQSKQDMESSLAKLSRYTD
jgi:hypothetical protein